jgi:phosphoribosyl 1,2-cyclic phosphodiesterase
MKIRFWGTRGSIASPGPHTVKYGGNTSCVEISDEETLAIFDAGSGLRLLGEDLLKRAGKSGRIVGHLFISHFHLDHIVGFPFFPAPVQARQRVHDLRLRRAPAASWKTFSSGK